jgi:hypothetical protein
LYDVLRIDCVLPALTTLFVGGRILGRVLLKVGLGRDDWVMLAALVLYLGSVGTSLGLIANRFGEHTFWLRTSQIDMALKVIKSPSIEFCTTYYTDTALMPRSTSMPSSFHISSPSP